MKSDEKHDGSPAGSSGQPFTTVEYTKSAQSSIESQKYNGQRSRSELGDRLEVTVIPVEDDPYTQVINVPPSVLGSF